MKIKQYLKNIIINIKNRKNKSKISLSAIVSFDSKFEGCCRVYENVFFKGKLGYASYISKGSSISAIVGRFCSIGHDVKVIQGIHPTNTWISTHPAFFSKQKQANISFTNQELFNEHKYANPEERVAITIGNDVWIGDNVLIMPGIRISDGAIIGAGSIITKDVPPYAIVAGVPGKILKYRFSDTEIKRLIEFKWWDKSIEWIRNNHVNFSSFEKFQVILGEKENENM